MKEQNSRRDFLFLLGITTVAGTAVFWGPKLLNFLKNGKLFQQLEEFDESHERVSAIAITQEKNNLTEIPSILKKASFSVSYNGKGSGSATNIYSKDGVSVFLTAKHCIPSEDIYFFSINQPHFSDSHDITFSSNNITIVKSEEKDLAIIIVNTPFNSFTSVPISLDYDFNTNINDKFCVLSFPVVDETKTAIGIVGNLSRNWNGGPLFFKNNYQLESSIWYGSSGAGIINCETLELVGIVSGINFEDRGQIVIEDINSSFFNNSY